MKASLTRFAKAQREIDNPRGGAGRPWQYAVNLLRTANMPNGRLILKNGSITGIYTVLVESDDTNERLPIRKKHY
jgi:flagellar biosynthesis/type III secretory pathway ATPase